MKKNIVNDIVFYLIVIILAAGGCANPLPPSGGPPDTTPPEIIYTEPSSGALNFNEESIILKFNKYMDKIKVTENVFLSPSKKIKFDWSGKELEIEFDETLDSNTTYALTIGTDYSDIYQNKPTQAFTLIFSTGNHIDSGAIKGQLWDKEPSGVYIFAYKLDDIDPDTLNPTHTKPQFRTQVGTNGNFELLALKSGTYQLFAVRDKFKDDIYDEGTDDFGAPANDAIVKIDSIPKIHIKIGSPIDKIGPMLFDAEAITEKMLTANFSEPLDTLTVNKYSFVIKDSAETLQIPVSSAYINTSSANRVDILTSEALDTTILWKVSAFKSQLSSDSINIVKDTAGNSIQDTANFAYFKASAFPDTLYPKLIKLPFPDSSRNIEPSQVFNFIFNTGIINDNFEERIEFLSLSDSNVIEYKIIRKAENIIVIVPIIQLNGDDWYEIDLATGGLSANNGNKMQDSTIKLRFQTKDTRNFGGASGIIKNIPDENGNYIVMLINKEDNKQYSTITTDSAKWSFPQLPQGAYRVEVIYDKNKNGRYDYGDAYPFRFGEPFAEIHTEINISPRWKLDDIVIEFPK